MLLPCSTLLLLLLLLLLPHLLFLQPVTHAHSQQLLSFSFDSLSPPNLTLLGDSFIHNGSLGLTAFTAVPVSSTGRALYNLPIRFLDRSTNSSLSFQTTFSFSITNQNAALYGDGLAFIIVPDNQTLGDAGRWLGVLNKSESGNPKDHTIAIEFDTFMDVNFFDINDNHVGLDINSMHSVATADIGSLQMELKSGNVITTWIEYNSSRGLLEVSMSYTGQKPQKSLLAANFSLVNFVNEFMYVGFASSTQGSQDLHSIYTWSFSTTGDPLPPPPISPVPSPLTSPAVPQLTPSCLSKAKLKCKGPLCLKVGVSLGIFIGAAVSLSLIVLSVGCCFYCKWKYLLKTSCSSPLHNFVSSPRKFTYNELTMATKGFSSSRIIGHGAFGTVYKGILPDTGAVVAVKRSVGNNQGKNEFLAELSIIACLRHRNLVQLLGWCREKEEILLVYDYMPQGSLDKILFYNQGMVLSWLNRYNIIMGVGAALAYLHGECEQQILHRDVKASNIMLDSNYNAKLGDFGLAKLTDHNKSPDATLTAGTMGYLAPEYIHTGKVSEKTDVFSFGAVVLEIACGRRPLERETSATENVLVDWVWGLYRQGRLLEAADCKLRRDYDEEEMNRVLQVGLLCSHPDPVARPTMRQVVHILKLEAEMPFLPRFKPTPSFAVVACTCSATYNQVELDPTTINFKRIEKSVDEYEDVA